MLPLIGGGAAILAVLGLGFFLLNPALKLEVPAPVSTGYSTASIDSLAASGSLLEKTIPLQDVAASQPAATQYQPDDLGKTDLIKSE